MCYLGVLLAVRPSLYTTCCTVRSIAWIILPLVENTVVAHTVVAPRTTGVLLAVRKSSFTSTCCTVRSIVWIILPLEIVGFSTTSTCFVSLVNSLDNTTTSTYCIVWSIVWIMKPHILGFLLKYVRCPDALVPVARKPTVATRKRNDDMMVRQKCHHTIKVNNYCAYYT